MKIVTCVSASGWNPIFVELLHALAASVEIHAPDHELVCLTDMTDYSRFPRRCAPVPHRLAFETEVLRAAHRGVWNGEMALGSFMRMDIPVVAAERGWSDQFLLYVDVDTMLVNRLESLPDWTAGSDIEYFAAAPEFDRNDWSYFNAGVLLLNLEGMKRSYGDLLAYAEDVGFVPEFSVVDQGIYNEFYKDRWSRLPWKYNHKAFSAVEGEEPVIVHFQGPKPQHLLGEIELPEALRLDNLNTDASKCFAEKWNREFRRSL